MAVVTLTVNPTVDISTTVEQVVAERKLRCAMPLREAGGGGLNVSRAIAHLGGESTAVYTAGGATGAVLEALLEHEHGLRGVPVPIADWTRESFVVTELTTSRQFRFGLPGPLLGEPEWRGCVDVSRDLLASGDVLVLSGSLAPGVPAGLVEDVAEAAHDAGARFAVDTSSDALRAAVGARPDIVKPNVGELAALLGRGHLDERDQVAAARFLVDDRGCGLVVVSAGAAGVIAATADQTFRVRAPVVPVHSQVGAGDSTLAGVVLGLTRGMAAADAVCFGVAAGASAVMAHGTGLCDRETTEHLAAGLRAEVVAPPREPSHPWLVA